MRSGTGRTWVTLRKQLVLVDRRVLGTCGAQRIASFPVGRSVCAEADSARLIAAVRKIGKLE